MQCGWAGRERLYLPRSPAEPEAPGAAASTPGRGGRSECLAEPAERRSHRRAGERWEGRAAGASVRREETQHLGAEQLHGAPQAGPAPRSPPLGAGGPRRRPPPASLHGAAAAPPRSAPLRCRRGRGAGPRAAAEQQGRE